MPNSTAEKIDKIKERLSARTHGVELIGCTESELEALKQAQHVSCLPEVYCGLLRLMGKQGMGWVLDTAYADYEELLSMKDSFVEEMNETGLNYPDDIFVFWEDQQGCGYRFFRTKDCQDDPAVYEDRDRSCFYKLAENLSSFIYRWIDIDKKRRQELTLEIMERRTVELRFDMDRDDFYSE